MSNETNAALKFQGQLVVNVHSSGACVLTIGGNLPCVVFDSKSQAVAYLAETIVAIEKEIVPDPESKNNVSEGR